MKEHELHEQFEMKILKQLSDCQLLNHLIFGGGTCLRLCHGLDRYSVDLDFWIRGEAEPGFFKKLKQCLERENQVTDHHEKHFSFLAEVKSDGFPKKLKIEIRKETRKDSETETAIAYSPYGYEQVRLRKFTFRQLFLNKISAILDRGEIRDAYDLEFMVKKDRNLIRELSIEEKESMLKRLTGFKPRDFKVKLGSLLGKEERDYYSEKGFAILAGYLSTL